MGNTERASFHCACRGLSDRVGAGIFSVVVVLFTAMSPPSRRGPAGIGRPPLCALRDTARRQRLPPPAVLLQLPRSALGRRTPAARSKETWRALVRRIPQPPPREEWCCLRATRSLAPEFEPVLPAEKIVTTAQRSLARSLSVSGRQFFPRRPSPCRSASIRSLAARHTTHRKRHRLPRSEMHAGRQRVRNARRLQLAEMMRLKIFSARLSGSPVSP